MMRFVVLTVIAAVSLSGLLEATELTMEDFLASARSDTALDAQDEKLSCLAHSTPNTPYVDRLEFRTATDEFRATDQSYRLRLYPTGWGETAAGKELFHTTKEMAQAERDMVLHEALKRRYLLIIDYIHGTELLTALQSLIKVEQDRLLVLRNRAAAEDFDIQDLIEAKEDLLNLQLDHSKKETELAAVTAEIKHLAGADRNIAFTHAGLIDPKGIKRVLDRIRENPYRESDNIHVSASRLAVEEEERRYALEKAQSRRYISFIETTYDNESSEHAREAFSVELGVELPLVQSNRLEITRRKLDFLSEKSRHDQFTQSLKAALAGAIDTLDRLLTDHQNMFSLYGEQEPVAAQAEGTDPLILLKMKEAAVQRDRARHSLRWNIDRRYIEVLDLSGRLIRKPMSNVLSTTYEEPGL